MDAVITFVNGLDPEWRKLYFETTNKPILEKRYRDWGLLKFLLRGIEKYMPFIENVFLVVSGESQIPKWADTSRLRIVLHKDIIPAKHLPLFNSASIECFIHRIPGLSEQYVYFNDDMYPVQPCTEEDFFVDGKSTIGFKMHIYSRNLYKKHARFSDRLARVAAGKKPSPIFIRPQHICSPMLKSACEELESKAGDTIDKSISTLREDYNYSQYLFLDYMRHTGRANNKGIPKKHFSMKVASAENIAAFLRKPTAKMVCINDVQMSEEKYLRYRKTITEAFEDAFPAKSSFEL